MKKAMVMKYMEVDWLTLINIERDCMTKRKKPYFRISIKGYYPEGSDSKLSAKFYFKSEKLVGLLLIKLAKMLEEENPNT